MRAAPTPDRRAARQIARLAGRVSKRAALQRQLRGLRGELARCVAAAERAGAPLLESVLCAAPHSGAEAGAEEAGVGAGAGRMAEAEQARWLDALLARRAARVARGEAGEHTYHRVVATQRLQPPTSRCQPLALAPPAHLGPRPFYTSPWQLAAERLRRRLVTWGGSADASGGRQGHAAQHAPLEAAAFADALRTGGGEAAG